MRRSVCIELAGLSLALLAASCSTPEATPPPAATAPLAATKPVIARAELSVDIPPPEAPPTPERSAGDPRTQAPPPAGSPSTEPGTPTPWGAPLEVTGKSHGLRFTTTAQVERTGTTLQLAIDVELHNPTRAPIPVARQPPLVTVMTAPIPGATGEGLGLGLRGEGMGSDVCSPGHGGPTTLRPGDRVTVARKLVELDPLPWPAGQAYRITATTRDCRPDRLTLEVLDATIIPPASPDGVPMLAPASPASSASPASPG